MPLALYLLALAVFAMGTSEFMLAGLVPRLATTLGVSVGAAGLLTSAFAAGIVVGAPAMAALSRRWPARATLLGSVLVFALAHVAGALTDSFPVLLGSRVVAALANAGFLAAAISTAAGLVPADRKGRALAVLLSGTTLAIVAGVPGGALLAGALGWRAPFWAIALLCLPAALGVVMGVPGGPRPGRGPDGGSLRSELAQLRSARLLLVMLLAALVNAGTFATFTFLTPVATGTAGLAEAWVPVVLVLFGAGAYVGITVAGRFSDRHPDRVLIACGPLLLLGWVSLAMFAAQPVALLVLVLSQGALAFAVGSTLLTRVLYAAPGAPVMGGSFATVALNVGAVAGPALGAAGLATPAGDVGPVWVTALLTGTALVLGVPLVRRSTSRVLRTSPSPVERESHAAAARGSSVGDG